MRPGQLQNTRTSHIRHGCTRTLSYNLWCIAHTRIKQHVSVSALIPSIYVHMLCATFYRLIIYHSTANGNSLEIIHIVHTHQRLSAHIHTHDNILHIGASIGMHRFCVCVRIDDWCVIQATWLYNINGQLLPVCCVESFCEAFSRTCGICYNMPESYLHELTRNVMHSGLLKHAHIQWE